jgi:hypothetical protein
VPHLLPKYAIVPPVETFTLTIVATVTYEFLSINAGLRDRNMATNIPTTECQSEINYKTRNENSAGLISILDFSVFKQLWRLRKFAESDR